MVQLPDIVLKTKEEEGFRLFRSECSAGDGRNSARKLGRKVKRQLWRARSGTIIAVDDLGC